MKKIILIASLLLTATFSSFAQGFEKGDVYLNLGIGLFDKVGHEGYFNYLGNKTEVPTFNLSADIGIHKWITVGPYLSYNTRFFKGGGYGMGVDHHWSHHGEWRDWKVNETWFYFGARATFKLTPFLNEVANTNIPENLDLYAGLLVGLNIYHKKVKDVTYSYKYNTTTTDAHAALLGAGARYMFSKNFSVYLEVYPFGYTSVLNTGISFKF